MKVEISDYKKDGNNRDISVDISEDDCISLDYSLALVIAPALKKFREDVMGHPGMITLEEWREILDKMIYSFDHIAKDGYEEEDPDKVEEGLELFGKWYLHLWW